MGCEELLTSKANIYTLHPSEELLWWPSGKASTSRIAHTGIDPFFPHLSHTSDLKYLLATQADVWLIGPVLGLLGLLSIHFEWMKEIASKFDRQLLSQCGNK